MWGDNNQRAPRNGAKITPIPSWICQKGCQTLVHQAMKRSFRTPSHPRSPSAPLGAGQQQQGGAGQALKAPRGRCARSSRPPQLTAGPGPLGARPPRPASRRGRGFGDGDGDGGGSVSAAAPTRSRHPRWDERERRPRARRGSLPLRPLLRALRHRRGERAGARRAGR